MRYKWNINSYSDNYVNNQDWYENIINTQDCYRIVTANWDYITTEPNPYSAWMAGEVEFLTNGNVT
jgi:hypothetical protein